LEARIKAGELQDDEIDNYVNFVFEGMQAMGDDVAITDKLTISNYSSKEP